MKRFLYDDSVLPFARFTLTPVNKLLEIEPPQKKKNSKASKASDQVPMEPKKGEITYILKENQNNQRQIQYYLNSLGFYFKGQTFLFSN